MKLVNKEKLVLPTFSAVDIREESSLYDYSSSRQARVYFIDQDTGYFLKRAKQGSLEKEVQLTQFFAQKGWAQEVIAYLSDNEDWLLTQKVIGTPASHAMYLENPKRLCQLLAQTLQKLHTLPLSRGELDNRTISYIQTVKERFEKGSFDPAILPQSEQGKTAQFAFDRVQEFIPHLKADCVIHGDFCLPNVILDAWTHQALIDWDCAGFGDRHIDLFWITWSLTYHLKTDRYKDYFLDCYGRQLIDKDILEAVSYFEAFG